MKKDRNPLDNYLNNRDADSRKAFLGEMVSKDQVIPLSFIQDILNANISFHEKSLLLQLSDYSDPLALEDFLTRGLYTWDQNVTSVALRVWASKTERLITHRTLPLPLDRQLPQRVSYTLLDISWYGSGEKTIHQFSEIEDLENLSPAFVSLLFYRALQWNHFSERLLTIGQSYLGSMSEFSFDGDKAIPYIIGYCLKFKPKMLSDTEFRSRGSGIWPEIIQSLQRQIPEKATLTKIEQSLKKFKKDPKNILVLMDAWPSIWNRDFLPTSHIKEAVEAMANFDRRENPRVPEIFGGIDSTILAKTVVEIENDKIFCKGLKLLGNLITDADLPTILDNLEDRFSKTENIASLMEDIPKRILIASDHTISETFTQIKEESKLAKDLEKFQGPEKDFIYVRNTKRSDSTSISRGIFMETAYGSSRSLKEDPQNFWDNLNNAWQQPTDELLEPLSQEARKLPFLYQLYYLDTLSRFQGIDRAALKVLDYIRYEERCIIHSAILALAGINTQRSIQELVAFLTRPNISFDLQMEIALILTEKDLNGLQSELRSAIEDLHLDAKEDSQHWELKETLRSMLRVETTPTEIQDQDIKQAAMPTSEELDNTLSGKIQSYHKLSSEVKRALRTAQFFHHQVESAGNLNNIDLSPAIDMQYKALELSFRENFEAPCGILINQGQLQRKLDVIGYARPIPPKMEEFETFIENLPTIKSIPFFSRFKLRKMLRALCQYRRGKRFTLDGLKAFGLFFVCFSRKDCRYGLADLFHLEGFSDEDLFSFVKKTHIFQDFRNRAAHEGFHPDASNDLNKIWEDTTEIIETMFKVKSALSISDTGHHVKGKSENPVIVKKSAS